MEQYILSHLRLNKFYRHVLIHSRSSQTILKDDVEDWTSLRVLHAQFQIRKFALKECSNALRMPLTSAFATIKYLRK